MKIIGICGKIGSGKSAAGVFLEELGGFVLDLDVEMHTLYAESCELQQKIAENFGAECVKNGFVDRVKLASRVFQRLETLQKLESIVYPLLQKSVEQKLEAAKKAGKVKIAAVEGALLFKWPEFSRNLDAIWVVEATDSVRLERLLKRGLTKEDAERRIQIPAQDPLPPNAKYFYLDNSGAISALQKRVCELAEI